jgi:hypothetical protein
MRPAFVLPALMLCLAMPSAQAGDGADRVAAAAPTAVAGTLLYLDQSDWRQADRARKIELAADFMRIYCGNPAMPAADLVTCLDQVRDAAPVFARALSCVATGGQRSGL